MKTSISIIIPTLNRPDQLVDLVKRLNYIVKQEEVIIVDDSKVDQGKEIEELSKFNLVYLNRGERMGVSSARNFGAKVASGRYLLFFDDDDNFTKNWLSDFRNSLMKNPDLVFCNMDLIEPDGKRIAVKVTDNSYGAMNGVIVIPGSWIISKDLFDRLGGYDINLHFGENTELFFRINLLETSIVYIKEHNFIYHPSETGGSKNLQNAIDSNLAILEKHDLNLSKHTKHLYHQVIGVNYLRFRRFTEARKHLWKAYTLNPLKMSTLGRFLISLFPAIATWIYSENVNQI